MNINVTFPPLEDNKLKVGFIDIARWRNMVWKYFYDPTIVDKGDYALWGAKGTNPRMPYYDGINHKDFGTSKTYVDHIENFGFGNYGDRISRDFGALAIQDRGLLETFIDLHVKGIFAESDYDVLRKFKQDFDQIGGWNPASVLKNPEELYEMGEINNKQTAKLCFNSIMTNGMRMCQRTNRFNVQKANSAASSLKEFIFMCTFKTYAMLKTDLYASVYHNDQVILESIFKGVGIMDFSYNKIQNVNITNDTTGSVTQGANGGRGDEALVASKTRMVLTHQDSYKIKDTINPPLYIDTNFMGVSLHTYFFKWLYAFCGRINFVNSLCWTSEGNQLNLDVPA